MLKQKGIDYCKLWLAGDTGTLDTKNQYYDTLNSLVNRYGLEDHVAFLGYRSDVAALMKAADVVVLPTHSEGSAGRWCWRRCCPKRTRIVDAGVEERRI